MMGSWEKRLKSDYIGDVEFVIRQVNHFSNLVLGGDING